jgi:hypothetical protein
MSRRVSWITGVLVGLLVAALAVVMYVMAPRAPAYSLHGMEIISTTASGEQVGTVLNQTAWALGDVNDLGNGRRQLASMHQSGQSWKEEGDKITAVRTLTEFDTPRGAHCVIEAVSIPGRPTLLLLKATDPQATMDLANEVLHQFQQLGIHGRRPGNTLPNPLERLMK